MKRTETEAKRNFGFRFRLCVSKKVQKRIIFLWIFTKNSKNI